MITGYVTCSEWTDGPLHEKPCQDIHQLTSISVQVYEYHFF